MFNFITSDTNAHLESRKTWLEFRGQTSKSLWPHKTLFASWTHYRKDSYRGGSFHFLRFKDWLIRFQWSKVTVTSYELGKNVSRLKLHCLVEACNYRVIIAARTRAEGISLLLHTAVFPFIVTWHTETCVSPSAGHSSVFCSQTQSIWSQYCLISSFPSAVLLFLTTAAGNVLSDKVQRRSLVSWLVITGIVFGCGVVLGPAGTLCMVLFHVLCCRDSELWTQTSSPFQLGCWCW